MDPWVTLSRLAAQLGVERSNARKIALKLGFHPIRKQLPGIGRHQHVLCWSSDVAELIKAERRKQGYEVPCDDV